ncbi:MAG: helix-turn-helix domain-containing protein [Bacteroidota bacterium]|nr:helix-turn-helix domain-containing protein [Bacteroidota bacterium]MDP4231503.1 helix-turn-helix domain-containing protein [Bacteroidota bacterium]MDP4237119.1 helix-turn-helix domain-containing protein [Bacteroidota bacterium]
MDTNEPPITSPTTTIVEPRLRRRETQGQRLRRMRDERGIKQGYISRVADITQAHLSRIENDESGVTKNTLRKIADAMNIPFEDLYMPKSDRDEDGPRVLDVDDVLSSDAALIRFIGGERPDDATMQWVKRTLSVMRSEIRRRREY